ncbi:Polyketide cyclase / dehydrase and lipid transport [Actinacidiphila yanglinensis]|uniref:Polyketide cyclase / dehydrase and lipid transport n=1 Tax=Actinacidiphila yanglinensis TaxID=310779 RepID=A0A1H6DQU2_9ACTN|nr:SRPBCC family protein [Actinacidiphila yanglinensis]SEG87669.1 Polyketide cyclase / dehydrase and lipid transport [Actinacidiphila yanglinensis]
MPDAADEPPDIHWPAGFTPDRADCYSGARITVAAPAPRVFDLLVAAGGWPAWLPGVTGVRFHGACAGPLRQHDSFELLLAERHRFEVLVAELVPHRRLGLSGIAGGLQLYHAWLLTPSSGGHTLVASELVARGTTATAIREAPPVWANRLNARWLTGLRERTEAGGP